MDQGGCPRGGDAPIETERNRSGWYLGEGRRQVRKEDAVGLRKGLVPPGGQGCHPHGHVSASGA